MHKNCALLDFIQHCLFCPLFTMCCFLSKVRLFHFCLTNYTMLQFLSSADCMLCIQRWMPTRFLFRKQLKLLQNLLLCCQNVADQTAMNFHVIKGDWGIAYITFKKKGFTIVFTTITCSQRELLLKATNQLSTLIVIA